jgi:arabinose-5-phosphate isomerase
VSVSKNAAMATAIRVLEAEAEAIRTLADRMDESFLRALDIAAACTGKIAVTGMGKSGIICKKSGETPEILEILNVSKRLGLPTIAFAGDAGSTLAKHADVFLDVSVAEEACPLGLAPTTSTAAALAMGDALAMALMERKGFCKEDFASVHPGGAIGKKLLKVEELMHRGNAIPKVLASTPMPEVIYEMSRKGLGMTAVTDKKGILLGVISDGDLRRLLQRSMDPLKLTAREVMTQTPKTIFGHELGTAALSKMEELKITSLVVVDSERAVVGVVHLHSLWRTHMF